MINFKEQDGELFRMLDEPVPLTPDAEMPCLVRLIEDDSPMGRFNRDASYSDVIGKLFVAQKIKENPLYSNTLHAYEKNFLNQDYCIASVWTLEIVGCPVEEGSRWWALYQMMQGRKVSYKGDIGNVYLALNQDGNVQYYDMYNLSYIGTIRSKLEFGKKDVAKTGWQLYKEPKPEPAKEQFEVGDWVKYDIDSYLQVIAPSGKERTWCRTLSGIMVYPYTSCLTKASPSEVIVHIGCLSGTIGKSSDTDRFLMWHSSPKIDFDYSIIKFSALDATTLEIVESLLKAQEEKK